MPKIVKPVGGDKGFAPFVSCELNDAEKSLVKEHLMTAIKTADFINDCLEEGYRISLSWDARNDAVSVIMTGISDTCVNKDLAMSGRGPSFFGAMTVLAYKHLEKLKGTWPRNSPQRSRDVWG